jgi:hypothetical protein
LFELIEVNGNKFPLKNQIDGFPDFDTHLDITRRNDSLSSLKSLFADVITSLIGEGLKKHYLESP